MKIITVNLPQSMLKEIDTYTCDEEHPNRTYPSRSELIRVAVREFLILHLNTQTILSPPQIEEEEKPSLVNTKNAVSFKNAHGDETICFASKNATGELIIKQCTIKKK